jgi:transcription-repair coupling factor (superfamily II helicase)
VRINLYARVARATDAHDLDVLTEEIEDRFGPLTAEAVALLGRARLKCLCRSRRVARIDVGPKAVAFTPRTGTSPEALLEGASSRERSLSRVKQGRLLFSMAEDMAAVDHLQLSTRLLQGMS